MPAKFSVHTPRPARTTSGWANERERGQGRTRGASYARMPHRASPALADLAAVALPQLADYASREPNRHSGVGASLAARAADALGTVGAAGAVGVAEDARQKASLFDWCASEGREHRTIARVLRTTIVQAGCKWVRSGLSCRSSVYVRYGIVYGIVRRYCHHDHRREGLQY